MTRTNLNSILQFTAPRSAEWIETQIPDRQPNEVLLKTVASAISIGSELPLYTGQARLDYPIYYPLNSGYENVAEILSIGEQVSNFQHGDYVVAFYGHQTHAVVPASKIIPIRQNISPKLALLSILTCDVAKGIRKLHIQPEETVLITGGGAIGLLSLFVLRAYGILNVHIMEPIQERQQLALQLGAKKTFHPQAISDEQYAVGLECSSRNEAFAGLQSKMQTNGRICILADGNLEPLNLSPSFHSQELTIVASSDGWDYHQHAKWYFQTIQENEHPLADIFQLTITPQQLPATFEKLAQKQINPIKIFIDYAAT